MNDYYYIPPKKPRIPKPVTIFDIVLLIAAVILGCILIPMDLSAGISGTSIERAKGIEKLVLENGVEKGYFDTLFETGTREPFVQADKKYGTYLIYKDGKYESFNYEKGQKTIFGSSSRQNAPVGFVSSSGLVSETEDGIYYENMKGFYGSADMDFSDSLFTEGTFDFEKTTDLLANGKDENISLADATAIYHYMKNGTIVGYADGVAWYVARNGQDGYHLLRDHADKPVSLAYDLGKYGKNVYMINNMYLMYEVDGDLYIYYNDEYNRRLDCGDDVVGLDYAINDDGKITIFAYTPSKLFRLDLTGNGVEYENLRIDDINNPDGMYITKEWNKTLCWLRYGKEYSIYES
jgi:hypothetical protein